MSETKTITEWQREGVLEGRRALEEIQRVRKHALDLIRKELIIALGKVEAVSSDNARHVYEHDVKPVLLREHNQAPEFKQLAGQVFRDARFFATGVMMKSGVRRNHGALIMTWRLR